MSVTEPKGKLSNDLSMLNMICEIFQEVTNREQIYPACLPTQQRTLTEGVHSGWSKPIPETFLTNHAPGFLKVYGEFYKQNQYKMTAFEKCEDPNNKDPFGFDVQYPTDTYYPKGRCVVT